MPVIYDAAPRPDYMAEIFDVNKVKIARGDLLDSPRLFETIRKHSVSRIVHTAALLGPGVQENVYWGVQVNIAGTVNIFEAARILDVERVVFASSQAVYAAYAGEHASGPITEDSRLMTSSFYSSTKLACEFLAMNYHRFYSLDYVALRYAGVFGPWSGPPGSRPAATMKSLCEGLAWQREVVLDPGWLFEIMYSKDAAEAAVLALYAQNLKERIFNIGSGEVYKSWEEIVERIRSSFPSVKMSLRSLKSTWDAPVLQKFDMRRAETHLGYRPRYGLIEAIGDYVVWIKEKRAR